MANWCSTYIRFYSSDKAQIEKFHNLLILGVNKYDYDTFAPLFRYIIKDLADVSENGLLRNYYLSCDKELSEVNKVYSFELHQEDAYFPEIEVWRKILNKDEFNNIEFVFRAEEPGCGVFINTDSNGMFYTDRYYIDFCLPDENGEDITMEEYFSTEQSALEYVNLYSKRKFETLDIPKITNYFKENFTDEDHYFRLAEYRDEYNG